MRALKKAFFVLLVVGVIIIFITPYFTQKLLRQEIFKHIDHLQNQGVMISDVNYQERYGFSQLNFNIYQHPIKIQNHYGFLEILSGFWLKSSGDFPNNLQGFLNIYWNSKIEFQSTIPELNWQGLNIPNTTIKFIRPVIWRANYQLILGENEVKLIGILPKKTLSIQALNQSILIIKPNWVQKIGLYPVLTLSYGSLLLPKNNEGNYQFKIKVENQKISLNKM